LKGELDHARGVVINTKALGKPTLKPIQHAILLDMGLGHLIIPKAPILA